MPDAKILIVDDDPDFVEIIRTVLESDGYDVISARNGLEALARVKADHPDLMLLDIMMSSVLEGLSVSEELAKDPEAVHMPVIMISSIADTSSAGLFPTDEMPHMDAWLSKPVDPQTLLAKVAELLG